MNGFSQKVIVAIGVGLPVFLFLLFPHTNRSAQNYPVGILQITAPADGTVVHPGQTVAVTVAPVSGNVFSVIMLAGKGPFVFSAPVYSAPYQFSLTVPQNIAAGKYQITAIGGRQGQTFGTSNPISLDVEPAAAITSIRPEAAGIIFSHPGDVETLKVFGTFADGSTMDITHSTGTTYTSQDTTAVTVNRTGIVTAVGVGNVGNTPILIQYGGQQSMVLASTRGLGPRLSSIAPTSGAPGTSVTLSGKNFEDSQGTSTVTFNGTPGTPSSWSATSIVVPVPKNATTGDVVVTVGGAPSNALSFSVLTQR
jgi:IPT/TIG domain/Bacterial Ig domain